eukprot:TRINITY_DN2469_c0_g1_i1.p1 TRINITY_DN2469_c0_g1~~TRINITY_DN2469_c0_g1_i1.p1  ORF type:complete len:184 (-),score=34.06 TRINITY_DN2469_c0_g1_i1:178-654(-)
MSYILSANDELLLDEQTGQLTVEVLQGRNLVPKDSRGTSDPYCKVGLVAGPLGDFCGKPWRTSTITHTLNPDWWEAKKNRFQDKREEYSGSFVKIECWDYDTFSPDDFMGQAYIDVGAIPEGVPTDLTLVMAARPGKEDHVSGEIQVRVLVRSLAVRT